jgi:transposase-like protein
MARKRDTDEFKIAAARLVREQDSSAKAAGERLGVDPCSVRDWVPVSRNRGRIAASFRRGGGCLALVLHLE